MSSIRQRGSRFQVLYRENGKQTSETFGTIEEAVAFQNKLDKPVQVVDTTKRGHVTVAGYVYDVIDGHSVRQTTKDGYRYAEGETAETIDPARAGRLHILEVQRLIRFMGKVVICVVPGWAAGGGHSLHVVCDMTIASEEHAIFKQTDADVASFDGGFGSAYLARQVGQKRAREIFFFGRNYSAREAFEMGMVNAVVPHAELEKVALEWAREILSKSPTAIRMLKYSFNLIDDGLVGQQLFAGETTRLAYMTDEAQEGRDQFLEKRDPDWSEYPWYY